MMLGSLNCGRLDDVLQIDAAERARSADRRHEVADANRPATAPQVVASGQSVELTERTGQVGKGGIGTRPSRQRAGGERDMAVPIGRRRGVPRPAFRRVKIKLLPDVVAKPRRGQM